MTNFTLDDIGTTMVWLFDKCETMRGISTLFDQITEDQDEGVRNFLCKFGVADTQALHGFLLCYFTIRRTQKKQATDELERMFRLGE